MGQSDNLRAGFFASISIDFAHRSAGDIVGCEAPVDTIVALHATGREVQVIRTACVLCCHQLGASTVF